MLFILLSSSSSLFCQSVVVSNGYVSSVVIYAPKVCCCVVRGGDEDDFRLSLKLICVHAGRAVADEMMTQLPNWTAAAQPVTRLLRSQTRWPEMTRTRTKHAQLELSFSDQKMTFTFSRPDHHYHHHHHNYLHSTSRLPLSIVDTLSIYLPIYLTLITWHTLLIFLAGEEQADDALPLTFTFFYLLLSPAPPPPPSLPSLLMSVLVLPIFWQRPHLFPLSPHFYLSLYLIIDMISSSTSSPIYLSSSSFILMLDNTHKHTRLHL